MKIEQTGDNCIRLIADNEDIRHEDLIRRINNIKHQQEASERVFKVMLTCNLISIACNVGLVCLFLLRILEKI